MLINFEVQNFTSIKDRISLSAETGERLRKFRDSNTITENGISLLKSLLIFGPNGSGKSNLLDGLHLMRGMVLNNTSNATENFRYYYPFKLNSNSQKNDVSFLVEFNYVNQTYRYEFSFNRNEITSEKLTLINSIKDMVYFDRDHQNFDVLPDNLKEVSIITRANSLLLFNAQQYNDEVSINVFKWFKQDLIFVNDTVVSDQLIDLMKNDFIKDEFLKFLQFADFNIVNVNIREVGIPPIPEQFKQIINSLDSNIELPTTRQELYAVHKKYNDDGDVIENEEIPLSMESRGTQKIFLIALSIIDAQVNGNGKTLLFDEFDDSLHFELSNALIHVFNSVQNKNQFILTTHELQLLDADLRVDQIYLMEKDFQGVSDLKSVFDFSDARTSGRRDIAFMRRYMEGRFGAMPQIDVDSMLSSLDFSLKGTGENG
ncbi:ATP-binding protein [Companilactobacillus allii]|uniref:AAA+ ATPase domain-containing protein n=1 Tax=Companilactobacillus allii TaxID=1847728 RepID=A0A1P8Q220_9LACO|nr:ATP-binding protein [Companilactobacillus allii]APX71923.1 hypothetical protein BTM29_04850 [Companilactobacillus allii]USQ69017.1 ATP-binding protein [Companilactobacillus allii]